MTRSALSGVYGFAQRFESGSLRYAGIRHRLILLTPLRFSRRMDAYCADASSTRLNRSTSVFPIRLAEFALEHLSRVLAGQRVVERHDLGHLVPGQMISNVRADVVGVKHCAFVEFDRGGDRFA